MFVKSFVLKHYKLLNYYRQRGQLIWSIYGEHEGVTVTSGEHWHTWKRDERYEDVPLQLSHLAAQNTTPFDIEYWSGHSLRLLYREWVLKPSTDSIEDDNYIIMPCGLVYEKHTDVAVTLAWPYIIDTELGVLVS